METFLNKIDNILCLLGEIYASDNDKNNMNDMLRVKAIILKNKSQSTSNEEAFFWTQCSADIFYSSVGNTNIYQLRNMILIHKIFVILSLEIKHIREIEIKKIENKKLIRWINYFRDDILGDYFNLMSNFDYLNKFHYDYVIRGIRTLDEKLTFWVFVIHDGFDKWNPEDIIEICDYNLNSSRISLYSSKDVSTTHLLNGKKMNTVEYLENLYKFKADVEKRYFDKMETIANTTISQLRLTYKLNEEQIDSFKSIINNKSKNKKKQIKERIRRYGLIEKTIDNKQDREAKLIYEREEALYNKLTCCIKIKRYPRNVYDHIDNILKMEGNTEGLTLSRISEFRSYVDKQTNNELLVELGSNIEYNLSNHIMFDNMAYGKNKLAIISNKIKPISLFQLEFVNKFSIYEKMIFDLIEENSVGK